MPPLPLILASGSPRRAWLLTLAGVPFVVSVPDISEAERAGESPDDHVVRLAREKACEVVQRFPGRAILAADTAVVLGERIFGKPPGLPEGKRMLGELQGKTHRVLTGYVVRAADGSSREGLAVSLVSMRTLRPADIDAYLQRGEYADKAGAYAAQGEGAGIIEKIEGSYTNVVGLPLGPILPLLRELEYEPVDPGLD